MKRSVAALVLATSFVFAGSALAQGKLDKVVKVGSLGDQSGLYADIGGPGSSDEGGASSGGAGAGSESSGGVTGSSFSGGMSSPDGTSPPAGSS